MTQVCEKYAATITTGEYVTDLCKYQGFSDMLGIAFVIVMLVLMLCVMCPFWLVYHLLRRFSNH